jgi:hypothetical protein
MKSFESFIESFDVVPTRPNQLLAQHLRQQAQIRHDYFTKLVFDTESCTFVLEQLYESVRELLDANLAEAGYKSYSHEAVISFAWERKLLNHQECIRLDDLRIKRNKTHYQGILMTWDYSQSTRPLVEKIYENLKKE